MTGGSGCQAVAKGIRQENREAVVEDSFAEGREMNNLQRWILVICAAIFLLAASYTFWTWRGTHFTLHGKLVLYHQERFEVPYD